MGPALLPTPLSPARGRYFHSEYLANLIFRLSKPYLATGVFPFCLRIQFFHRCSRRHPVPLSSGSSRRGQSPFVSHQPFSGTEVQYPSRFFLLLIQFRPKLLLNDPIFQIRYSTYPMDERSRSFQAPHLHLAEAVRMSVSKTAWTFTTASKILKKFDISTR